MIVKPGIQFNGSIAYFLLNTKIMLILKNWQCRYLPETFFIFQNLLTKAGSQRKISTTKFKRKGGGGRRFFLERMAFFSFKGVDKYVSSTKQPAKTTANNQNLLVSQ